MARERFIGHWCCVFFFFCFFLFLYIFFFHRARDVKVSMGLLGRLRSVTKVLHLLHKANRGPLNFFRPIRSLKPHSRPARIATGPPVCYVSGGPVGLAN